MPDYIKNRLHLVLSWVAIWCKIWVMYKKQLWTAGIKDIMQKFLWFQTHIIKMDPSDKTLTLSPMEKVRAHLGYCSRNLLFRWPNKGLGEKSVHFFSKGCTHLDLPFMLVFSPLLFIDSFFSFLICFAALKLILLSFSLLCMFISFSNTFLLFILCFLE